MLIEIEGIDGVGKTTQSNLLKTWICKETGRKVIVVKDIDNTDIGRSLQKIIRNMKIPPIIELFFFLACKYELHHKLIYPFLSEGGVIICDRGIGSFVSYFEAHGFKREFLFKTALLATNNIKPAVTLLLDVPIEEAIRRNANKKNQSKFDRASKTFLKQQREIFVNLAQLKSWATIKGCKTIEQTHLIIRELLSKELLLI